MVVPKWRMKIVFLVRFYWKLATGVFQCDTLHFFGEISEIRDGGSKMAGENSCLWHGSSQNWYL